jgi:hypothetical protein
MILKKLKIIIPYLIEHVSSLSTRNLIKLTKSENIKNYKPQILYIESSIQGVNMSKTFVHLFIAEKDILLIV